MLQSSMTVFNLPFDFWGHSLIKASLTQGIEARPGADLHGTNQHVVRIEGLRALLLHLIFSAFCSPHVTVDVSPLHLSHKQTGRESRYEATNVLVGRDCCFRARLQAHVGKQLIQIQLHRL